jgi:RNA polymerase sigma-32 factor
MSIQSETGASVAAREPAAPNQLTRKLAATRQAQPPGREEELALLERWRRDGDRAARDRLLTANLRAVAATAYRYRHYGVPLDELIAEGNIALLHALSRFDPGRGTRFMTYAAFWVRAHVLNAVVESFSMVGAGSGALRTKMFFKLRRERARIATMVGDGEHADRLLAESMGLPLERVRAMLSRLEQRDVSLDGAEGPGAPAPLAGRLASPLPSHEESLADLELAAHVRSALAGALGKLDARERFIAERRLLADEEDLRSFSEIGRQLGV